MVRDGPTGIPNLSAKLTSYGYITTESYDQTKSYAVQVKSYILTDNTPRKFIIKLVRFDFFSINLCHYFHYIPKYYFCFSLYIFNLDFFLVMVINMKYKSSCNVLCSLS